MLRWYFGGSIYNFFFYLLQGPVHGGLLENHGDGHLVRFHPVGFQQVVLRGEHVPPDLGVVMLLYGVPQDLDVVQELLEGRKSHIYIKYFIERKNTEMCDPKIDKVSGPLWKSDVTAVVIKWRGQIHTPSATSSG